MPLDTGAIRRVELTGRVPRDQLFRFVVRRLFEKI